MNSCLSDSKAQGLLRGRSYCDKSSLGNSACVTVSPGLGADWFEVDTPKLNKEGTMKLAMKIFKNHSKTLQGGQPTNDLFLHKTGYD